MLVLDEATIRLEGVITALRMAMPKDSSEAIVRAEAIQDLVTSLERVMALLNEGKYYQIRPDSLKVSNS